MSNTKTPAIVAPPQNGTTTNTNNHHQIDEGENDGKKMGTKMAVPANVVDEGPSPFVQPGVAHKKLMATRIHFLDDTEHTFHVHQKAKGSVLTSLVAAQLELREKDYFGLAYYDEQKLQHWLYPDKRIKKQLKCLPLKFWFQVKFYPPQPTQLTEDLTRFLLYLQLRRDVHTERLPVSFAAQANLGAFIAQAMLGDYQESDEYADHLNNAHIAQPTTEQEQFIGHVRELHRQHRGLTPQEAELGYLNACKVLAMYGVHLYPAKDGKGKPVQIGISSHGISVFSEQMRVHRFAWPGIIKFSHRRHYFSIKLKAGEVDPKKETSLTYTLVGGKEHAKLLWECAVEHHGFFRLIQPDRKLKHHHLFGFGSARFRYVGRTNIQSQMASQLFEAPSIDEHVKSSKSADQIVVKSGPAEHSSPLNYADETTPQKSQQQQQQQNQREQRDSVTHQQLHYHEQIGTSKDKQNKKGKKKKTDHEKKAKKQNGQKATATAATTTSASSSSSSSSSSDAEEIHVLVQDEEGKQQQQMPAINDQQQPQQHVHEDGTMVGEPPHTTTSVRTWHEQSSGPQRITTEVDEHGNVIRRVVTTEHVRHTVQTHSYQTKSAAGGEHGEGDGGGTTNAAAPANSTDDNANKMSNAAADAAVATASPPRASLKSPPPVPPARRRSSATSPQSAQTGTIAAGARDGTTTITTSIVNGGTTTAVNGADDVGELVATKVVTTGNRTIETLTYKKEQDGMVETRVEHRITIHSNEDIDHEAELDRAISEATKMNPHMKVEKVEVERTTSGNNNSP
ncbi:hypothetical protein niasHS_014439 [Heterodera schachtii]|uniref:FERM domain-containing protein n=1 Tax=Heterodera schachtii TaxID=97005 RepID=A0ABD2I4H9_HETSC